jgi:hypothetical protein
MSAHFKTDDASIATSAGRALRWLIGPCLLVLIALGLIDLQLQSPAPGFGIVDFELCALDRSCVEILSRWSAQQRELAMLSLGLDYLFLVLYPAVLAAALLAVRSRQRGRARQLSLLLAGLVVFAGVLDGIENYLLVRLLMTAQVQAYALPAALAASLKFAIVGLALLWVAGGAAGWLWRRSRQ